MHVAQCDGTNSTSSEDSSSSSEDDCEDSESSSKSGESSSKSGSKDGNGCLCEELGKGGIYTWQYEPNTMDGTQQGKKAKLINLAGTPPDMAYYKVLTKPQSEGAISKGDTFRFDSSGSGSELHVEIYKEKVCACLRDACKRCM